MRMVSPLQLGFDWIHSMLSILKERNPISIGKSQSEENLFVFCASANGFFVGVVNGFSFCLSFFLSSSLSFIQSFFLSLPCSFFFLSIYLSFFALFLLCFFFTNSFSFYFYLCLHSFLVFLFFIRISIIILCKFVIFFLFFFKFYFSLDFQFPIDKCVN